MDLSEDKRAVTLPMKRTLPSKTQAEEEPVLKKKQFISDSESEFDDDYLDDLESRLEKKLGPGSNFEDEMFMKSPFDSIFAAEAEGISSDRFEALMKRLETLPDGEQLVQLAEFNKSNTF